MKPTPIFFVLYDGIENSVFESQVLAPLEKQLTTSALSTATLVSFERNVALAQQKAQTFIHPNLKIIIARKFPFLGMLSVAFASGQLKRILPTYMPYTLICRGPIAALIGQYAAGANCIQIKIQARGLLEQEYLFEHANEKNIVKKLVHKVRAKQLRAIEQHAFVPQAESPCVIETVSLALKDYLVTHYKSNPDAIVLAQQDIPAPITQDDKVSWKNKIRAELGIAPSAYIYCYNGSIKPWQAPEMVIEFFAKEQQLQPDCHLLILTQDVQKFKLLIEKSSISPKCYTLLTVNHNEIYRYLAACDAGLLFRHKHPVNWVSRPTKALEYKAAGLKIIHNNTVHYVNQEF